jgi:hypothetical protein
MNDDGAGGLVEIQARIRQEFYEIRRLEPQLTREEAFQRAVKACRAPELRGLVLLLAENKIKR